MIARTEKKPSSRKNRKSRGARPPIARRLLAEPLEDRPLLNASWEETVSNPDGSFTFQQRVDEASTAPHYVAPGSGGFEIYSWYNEDYSWQHTFPAASQPGLQVNSVSLSIHAWDVDAEPERGYDGEYDGITGDGNWFNPQYLQGSNNTWYITVFNVDSSLILDGELNVGIDIDMHERGWATTLDYSLLVEINYVYSSNNPPGRPVGFGRRGARAVATSLTIHRAGRLLDHVGIDGRTVLTGADRPTTHKQRFLATVEQRQSHQSELVHRSAAHR